MKVNLTELFLREDSCFSKASVPLRCYLCFYWTSCFFSVTEDEIERGILKAKDPNKHCHWFKRDITDMYNNADDMKARNFVDKVGKSLDKEATDLVELLKTKKLASVLNTNNITQYQINWHKDNGVNPKENVQHSQYLDKLCANFLDTLKTMIDNGIQERW